MGNQDTKLKLIETTKNLLKKGISPNKLTARQISSEAGTNLAMINYCFKSKDELLKVAVEEIVAEEFSQYSGVDTSNLTAREQLRELLIHTSSITMKFRELTRASVPYIMLEDSISLPMDILPYIIKHFGSRKSETECRVIAFQLVYSMQLIFYRADDFLKYSGIDITDSKQMIDFIDMQLDLFMGGVSDEKEL